KVPGTDGLSEMNHSRRNTIPIFGDEEEVRRAVRSIRTAPIVRGRPIPTDGNLVLDYLQLVDDSPGGDVLAEVRDGFQQGSMGYETAKDLLTNRLLDFFSEAREHYFSASLDQNTLEDILSFGAKQARQEFQATLEQVRDAVGFGPYTNGRYE